MNPACLKPDGMHIYGMKGAEINMKRSIRNYNNAQKKQAAQQMPPEAAGYEEMLGQMDPDAVGSMQNAVEHYSGKNDTELMEELRQYRAAGAFDDRALQDVAARLAPMLTPEQQQRLFSVIQQL